jgi:hypothetical protein
MTGGVLSTITWTEAEPERASSVSARHHSVRLPSGTPAIEMACSSWPPAAGGVASPTTTRAPPVPGSNSKTSFVSFFFGSFTATLAVRVAGMPTERMAL